MDPIVLYYLLIFTSLVNLLLFIAQVGTGQQFLPDLYYFIIIECLKTNLIENFMDFHLNIISIFLKFNLYNIMTMKVGHINCI